jgi:hypothetical protein
MSLITWPYSRLLVEVAALTRDRNTMTPPPRLPAINGVVLTVDLLPMRRDVNGSAGRGWVSAGWDSHVSMSGAVGRGVRCKRNK